MDDLFHKLCEGLTPEEIEQLKMADLPIGRPTGTAEITEEEKKHAEEIVLQYIDRREKVFQERKAREQGGNE